MKNKDISYGHWYPIRPGGMPEDLLGYQTFDKIEITETVLIPHHWGNEHGGGDYYPACRMRKRSGNGILVTQQNHCFGCPYRISQTKQA